MGRLFARPGATVKLALAGAIVMALVLSLGALGVGAQDPVTVNANVSTEGTVTVVDISITNNGSDPLGQLTITAFLPATGKLVSFNPTAGKVVGAAVQWIKTTGTAPGAKIVGYQVKIDGAQGNMAVNVDFITSKTSGTATTGNFVVGAGGETGPAQAGPSTGGATPTPTPEPPRRGCLACHTLVDKATGRYTLGFEAEERAKADYGADHPGVAPSGAKVDPLTETGPAPCLECHKPSTSNPQKGAGAPITLRDIVHPAHMFSQTFVEHYNGNCFTCHNVRGDGDFELLGSKVDVNEKGVPKSLQQGTGAIPGEILPSED